LLNIEETLGKNAYKKAAQGIYCRKLNADWSGYIAVALNRVPPIHSVGTINQSINKIMYRTVKKVAPPSPVKISAVSYGPPLCVVSPVVLAELFEKSNPDPSEDKNAIHLPFESWLKSADWFVERNSSLESALYVALAYNKFMQAQRYCIPVAYLMLADRRGFNDYVSEWISVCESREEVELYKKYVALLLQEWT
jgi:hypothetical protein